MRARLSSFAVGFAAAAALGYYQIRKDIVDMAEDLDRSVASLIRDASMLRSELNALKQKVEQSSEKNLAVEENLDQISGAADGKDDVRDAEM